MIQLVWSATVRPGDADTLNRNRSEVFFFQLRPLYLNSALVNLQPSTNLSHSSLYLHRQKKRRAMSDEILQSGWILQCSIKGNDLNRTIRKKRVHLFRGYWFKFTSFTDVHFSYSHVRWAHAPIVPCFPQGHNNAIPSLMWGWKSRWETQKWD